jgi:hypothetical protein
LPTELAALLTFFRRSVIFPLCSGGSTKLRVSSSLGSGAPSGAPAAASIVSGGEIATSATAPPPRSGSTSPAGSVRLEVDTDGSSGAEICVSLAV